jgi:hypothetical protein
MANRWACLVFVLGSIIVGGLTSASPASAETLVQATLDSRMIVHFRVNPAELQRWLPAPWQSNPIATGPSKDANLVVTFVDRVLDQNAEGKPAEVPAYRVVSVAVPAKHPQTGDSGPLVMRLFSSNPTGVPGFYKTAVQATVTREQTLKGVSVEPGTATDWWEMRDGKGGTMELRVQYTRGAPTRGKVESKPRSGSDPAVWRIYRIDQALDVIKSVPVGIDRVQNYQIKVAVPEMSKMFDGSEKLISLTAVPFYTRQTFLP